MESLSDKLIVVIVDKLLIGLLIGVSAYILSRLLETFKSKQQLFNEMAKVEVNKISECWEHAYESESIIKRIVHKTAEIQTQNAGNKLKMREIMENEISPLFDLSSKKTDEFQESLARNRFWIASPLYEKFNKFHNSLVIYLNAYPIADMQGLKNAEMEIDNNRLNINEILLDLNVKRNKS